MSIFPNDIEKRIDQLFPDAVENAEVRSVLRELFIMPLNVGVEQLVRSILTLSEGRIDIVNEIMEKEFYGDPRDIIMRAERKAGNPGHYFIPPFEEIEEHS